MKLNHSLVIALTFGMNLFAGVNFQCQVDKMTVGELVYEGIIQANKIETVELTTSRPLLIEFNNYEGQLYIQIEDTNTKQRLAFVSVGNRNTTLLDELEISIGCKQLKE